MLLVVLLLAASFAASTALFGWLAVPLVALATALLGAVTPAARAGRDGRISPALLAASASLGWAALLAIDAARGPLWPLAERLGLVLGVPAVVLTVATVGFAALLAWSAAAVVTGVLQRTWGAGSPPARGGS